MPINSVSGNPIGLSAHALHAAARSRAGFIGLLLLSTIGGVTSTLPAQGNPKPVDPNTNLALITSGDTGLDHVCAGASVVFKVIAVRRTNPALRVNEVLVLGSVLDSSYGTLKPTSARTWALSTPSGSTVFTFAGLRPGATELRFEGVGSGNAGDDGPRTNKPLKRGVKVVSCDSAIQPPVGSLDEGAGSGVSKGRKAEVKKVKPARISKVKVTTRSTWSAGMDIVATIDSGVMVADDQGHFTGSASVTWWTSVIGSAGCGAAEYTVPPSKADLAGEIDESNQLVVTITFEPRDFSGFATCGPTISTGNLATPDPLTVSVPATGGTSTQAHAVTAKNGSFAGSATIVVTPERK